MSGRLYQEAIWEIGPGKSRLRYLAHPAPEQAQSLSAKPLICGVDVSGVAAPGI
jgi:hypothetical protein